MGFRLVVVTARAQEFANESWSWVDKHFPGVFSLWGGNVVRNKFNAEAQGLFDSLVCTGQFKDYDKDGCGVATKLRKAEVGDTQDVSSIST